MSTSKLIVEAGDSLYLTATADIKHADIIPFGGGIGVAVNDAVIGKITTVLMTGVIVRPVTTADTIVQGDIVYWDDTNKEFTSVDTGIQAGIAWENKTGGIVAEIGVKIG